MLWFGATKKRRICFALIALAVTGLIRLEGHVGARLKGNVLRVSEVRPQAYLGMVRLVELAEVGDTPNQEWRFRGGPDTDYVNMGVVGEGVSGDNVNSLARLFFRAST